MGKETSMVLRYGVGEVEGGVYFTGVLRCVGQV